MSTHLVENEKKKARKQKSNFVRKISETYTNVRVFAFLLVPFSLFLADPLKNNFRKF